MNAIYRRIRKIRPLHQRTSRSISFLYGSRNCYERLGKFSYWKSKYQQSSQNFDWFLDPGQLTDVIHRHVQEINERCCLKENTSMVYLEIGCGTSDLPHKVLKTAKVSLNMVLVDFVQEALQYQATKLITGVKREADTFVCLLCADVTCLPLGECSTHLAIDKGTMDAVLRDKTRGHEKCQLMLSEVMRVLTSTGRFLQISDEDPDSRLRFLEECDSELQLRRELQSSSPGCPSDANVGVMQTYDHVGVQTSTYCETSVATCHANLQDSIDNCGLDMKKAPLSKAWSFSILPSNWSQEYFLYWRDK